MGVCELNSFDSGWDQWGRGTYEREDERSGSIRSAEFLDYLSDYWFLIEDSDPWC